MGRLISELRKSKQITQKDLAAKLNITDKAVSKWECGLICPDISLLSAIAETLGVTTGELLNGKNSNVLPRALKKALIMLCTMQAKPPKANRDLYRVYAPLLFHLYF